MSQFLFGLACITSLGKKGTLFPVPLCRHLRTLEAGGWRKVEGVFDIGEQGICSGL